MSAQPQFDMAVLLCNVAVELDYAKNVFSPCHHDHAAAIVLEMHKLAEALAGAPSGKFTRRRTRKHVQIV